MTNVLKYTRDLEDDIINNSDLRDTLNEELGRRDYYLREIHEAEAELAHIAARVQKRKATLAKIEAHILELRTAAHMRGVDRQFGKDLMGL